ncbi:homologous recombination OB-fold protein isoform X2 [Pleurodeles waltl]
MCQNVNNMSPVLGFQNNSRLIAGMTAPSRTTSSLRAAGQGRLQSTTCMSFTNSREGFTTCEGVLSVPSNCGNSNNQTSQHSARSGRHSTTTEELADDGLDDDLLLSACTEIEMPSIGFNPIKRGEVNLKLPKETPGQATPREHNICEGPLSKKLRENSQKAMPDPGLFLRGAEGQKSDAALISSPFAGVPCNTTLNLRPSSVSEMQSGCLPAASCIGTVVQNVPPCSKAALSFGIVSGYQVARSVLKPGPPSQVEVSSTHQSPTSQCPIRSPSESRTLRPSALPAPLPGGHSPRVPGSTFRQPPRRPHDSCALMSSIASPCSSPRVPCGSSPGPNNLHPVMTNHLVQLVTAANQTPQASSRSSLRSKSRRFPGPAGILPQPHTVKNLEEILVSTPHTPTHGAMAKMRTQEESSSQQSVEEEFGRGPWMTMKTELGIDEKNPTCFLQSYSVIMVLRKAALKQLPKNKVPNMAVMLKSMVRSNVDASAVFRDPTGEMQGTLHHLLLEERESDLKAGCVLLLQQVGVFSPSSRSHYLNVTPNNVVKIYPADGVSQSAELQEAQNPPLFRVESPSIGEGATESQGGPFRPISQNKLKCNTKIEVSQVTSKTLNSLSLTLKSHSEDGGPPEDWDMDDDLDSLMGELPED